ncbi:MAG: zinc-binding dehydrogenase [Acetobacteraceae bacterium]
MLVSGSGPIGALCVLAVRHAGAREVVATDLVDAPLALVRRLGADRAVNLRADPKALDGDMVDKGRFDAVFECSGSGAGADDRAPRRAARRRRRAGRRRRRGRRSRSARWWRRSWW